MVARPRNRITEVLRRIEQETVDIAPYRFGKTGEYEISVAGSIRDRLRAWALAYKVYLEKEYAERNSMLLWYGIHDALPETTTFVAQKNGQIMAALTVVFDSPLKLPADELYSKELTAMCAAGRSPCELVSLVSSASSLREGVEVTRHLFKLAYLTARRLERASDFVITVNPRHVRFYKRTLLFEEAGPEREYDKVGGAPAVLLRLNLETAEERYRECYGEKEGSFYRFFIDQPGEERILSMLRRGRQVLGEAALRKYFIERRALISQAGEETCKHLHDCYPFYDLRVERKKSDTRPLAAV